MAISTAAQTPSSEDIAQRAIERRAIEAVTWGMPAVNYDPMFQAMLSQTAAKPNEVVYWSMPSDWKNQTLTPDPDAICFMIFYDTKDAGPIAIDVPPAEGVSAFAANIEEMQ